MSNAALQQTVKDKLTLRGDGSGHLKWHCDAAFALHGDFLSHIDSTFTMGDGAITSLSTRSSTEVEVVAKDEIISTWCLMGTVNPDLS